jgi:hypothetical protein
MVGELYEKLVSSKGITRSRMVRTGWIVELRGIDNRSSRAEGARQIEFIDHLFDLAA